jgi:DMSO/TMAO reductase YedYZ heme-binding membrane subunit
MVERPMSMMLTICGYGVCLFMGLLCATLLWMIWTGKINLSTLLTEANGQASMSRLQLLVFTLVIAISLFILVERGMAFPAIPDGVLTLLGISASTYAVGKAISYSRDEGVTTPDERASVRATAQALSATGAASVVTPGGTASTGATDTGNQGS